MFRPAIFPTGATRKSSFAASQLALQLLATAVLGLNSPAFGMQENAPSRTGSAAAAPADDSPSSVKAIKIIPLSVAVAIGEPQSFKLVDDRGRPVQDAEWVVSDAAIADLQLDLGVKVTGVAPGKVTLTATWRGLTAQARVRILGGEGLSSSSSGSSAKTIWISPNTLAMVVDEPRMVRLNDARGRPIQGVQWSVSDPSIAEIVSQTATDVMIQGRAPGEFTVTGSWQGQLADAKVTVFPGPDLPHGTIPWSIEAIPGYSTVDFTHAQPGLIEGPNIFITEHDGCGNYVSRGFTIDGREMWRKELDINQGRDTTAGSTSAPAARRLPLRIPQGALAARPELMNPPPAKCPSNPAAPPPTSPQEAVK